ncbi:hypothetical protein BGZ63DRAFT_463784 [Mariannaea sp. PMI_226]|nr:hypothetical protein BGZ63DRAFT_463784 [Mariannaea sp. PMI_226]
MPFEVGRGPVADESGQGSEIKGEDNNARYEGVGGSGGDEELGLRDRQEEEEEEEGEEGKDLRQKVRRNKPPDEAFPRYLEAAAGMSCKDRALLDKKSELARLIVDFKVSEHACAEGDAGQRKWFDQRLGGGHCESNLNQGRKSSSEQIRDTPFCSVSSLSLGQQTASTAIAHPTRLFGRRASKGIPIPWMQWSHTAACILFPSIHCHAAAIERSAGTPLLFFSPSGLRSQRSQGSSRSILHGPKA